MNTFVMLRVLKKTHAIPFLSAFLVVYLVGSVILWLVDPQVSSLQEGLWLGFNIVTSIGLGDFTVTRLVARLAAVALGLYGNLIVAFIPSLVAGYYLEKVKSVRQVTFERYQKELSHVSTLSAQEKENLAKAIHEQNHIFHSQKLRSMRRENGYSAVKALELFGLIFKQTHLMHFLVGFLITFAVCGGLIYIFDPSITSLYDAYWFCFTIVTTIGFGDFTVVHWTSRLVTVFLGLYGIFMIEVACGVIASYFLEVVHYGGRESVSQMLWKFEHLDLLSPQELRELEMEMQKAGIHGF